MEWPAHTTCYCVDRHKSPQLGRYLYATDPTSGWPCVRRLLWEHVTGTAGRSTSRAQRRCA